MHLPWSRRGKLCREYNKITRTLRIYRDGHHHLACSLVFASHVSPSHPIGDQIRDYIREKLKMHIAALERRKDEIEGKLEIKKQSE